MVWNDNVRAAFIAFVNAIFPVLQIFEIVSFTGEEVAQIMLLINLGLVFLGLVIKKGQQPGDPIVVAQGSETAPNKADLK